MRKGSLLAILIVVAAMPGFSTGFELGAIGGGGLSFATGSYFDSRAAQLAVIGSSSTGALGTTRADLLPGWSAGLYAELDILSWLGVRWEPRLSCMGGASLALSNAGAPLNRYGAFFYSIESPVLVRGILSLGPGKITVSAGGFYALVLGGVTVTDRSASATTTAVISQDFLQGGFFGVSGGFGYSLKMGPGVASLEARADWALTSATSKSGAVGAEILPLGISLFAGYGFWIGGGTK